jgi:DNA/RNA-binding domain of Phe-tRNA-synthetase-like protein
VWLKIAEEVMTEFPDLDVRLVEIYGVKVEEGSYSPDLSSTLEEVVHQVRKNYRLGDLKDVELVRYYRDFFWRIGIDPTKTRPSAEALLRRILLGKPFPRVNTLVDAYNMASVLTLIPVAAFDLHLLGNSLTMRRSRPGETFLGIGMGRPYYLTGRELVVEDGEKLIAIYPYRDADSTKVTGRTVNALIMVCGAPKVRSEVLDNASRTVIEYVTRFCGGQAIS